MSEIVEVKMGLGTVDFRIRASLRKADIETLRAQIIAHVNATFDKAILDIRKAKKRKKADA